jgi:hypothetical protein
VPRNLATTVGKVVAKSRMQFMLSRRSGATRLPERLENVGWLNQRAAAVYVPRR